jgi:hypothetical protein
MRTKWEGRLRRQKKAKVDSRCLRRRERKLTLTYCSCLQTRRTHFEDCPGTNDEQKNDLPKQKWKEWKADKRDKYSKSMSSFQPMDSAENRICPTRVGISRLISSNGDYRFPLQFVPNLVRHRLADTGSDTSTFTLHFLGILREHVRVDYEELPSPILHAVSASPYNQENPK